ncbi:MAG: cob(I)yrinic acid a,c-diamide adenosyltransferase [Candidatus Zapsychrus exili]|nr:cob(I)yrinic acid a,c-diamide adenosyltransferase [Candidatus Zapsychrus exili]
MTNITTKKGDKGTTSLFSGEKVSKSSPTIDALGDIDDLISILSVVSASAKVKKLKNEILCLQKILIVISSEVATTPGKITKLKRRLEKEDLNILDKKVLYLSKKVMLPKCFNIVQGSLVSSYIDLARAVSRRVERKIVTLFNKKAITNKFILSWVNRLSDYLFLLGAWHLK